MQARGRDNTLNNKNTYQMDIWTDWMTQTTRREKDGWIKRLCISVTQIIDWPSPRLADDVCCCDADNFQFVTIDRAIVKKIHDGENAALPTVLYIK